MTGNDLNTEVGENKTIFETINAGKKQSKKHQTRLFPDKVLVALACCLSAMISMGTALGMGSLYLDVMDVFNTSRPLAALVQSLCLGIGFGAGILTGPIMGLVGGPITIMAGSLLSGTGCIVGSFAPNIYVLIVSFGGLTGIGVSCLFLGSQVVMRTTFHDNKRLALPALSVCTGIGATIFPILIRRLENEFTLRGMYLILGGIHFQGFLMGFVIKVFGPVTNLTRKNFKDAVSVEREVKVDDDPEPPASRCEVPIIYCVTESDSGVSLQDISRASSNNTSEPGSATKNDKPELDFVNASSSPKAYHNIAFEFQEFTEETNGSEQEVPSEIVRRYSTEEQNVHNFWRESLQLGRMLPEQPSPESVRLREQTTSPESSAGYPSVDMLGGGATLQVHRGGPDSRRPSVVTISESVDILGCQTKMELNKDADDRSTGSQRSSVTGNFQRQLSLWSYGSTSAAAARAKRRRSSVSVAFQTTLIHNRPYVLVTCTCFVAFLTFNASVLFLADIVQQRGLSADQATQLLSFLFALNVVGRALVGGFQFFRNFSVLLVLGMAMFGCSLANLGYTLVDFVPDDGVLPAYTAVCAFFGLFLGLAVTCGPLACAELVEVTQYAPALGYQFFVSGVCSSLGGPLGGWLKDQTGSYNIVFYASLVQGVIGLVVCLTLAFSRHHHPHHQHHHHHHLQQQQQDYEQPSPSPERKMSSTSTTSDKSGLACNHDELTLRRSTADQRSHLSEFENPAFRVEPENISTYL